jgi:hypothetical protein
VERFDRGALVAAVIAAALGTASATVSAYWAFGGEALLDTVGGDVERWGRERSAGVVVALWLIVVVKLVGAVAPLVFVGVCHLPAWTRSRRTRALGWAAAVGSPGTAACSASLAGSSRRVWSKRQTMPTSMLLPGTHTCGIPGSRCGAVHSSWPCGAAVRNHPGKPFRTDPANVLHRRLNSAHGPARNRARSAVECAVSGEVDVATDAGPTTRIGTSALASDGRGCFRARRRAASEGWFSCGAY